MGKLRPRGSPAGLLGWEAVAPRQPLLVPPGSPLGGVWRMRRRPPVSSTGATRSGSFRLKTKTKEARPRSSQSRRSCEPPPASSPIPHCWAEGASRHQAPPRTGGPRAEGTRRQGEGCPRIWARWGCPRGEGHCCAGGQGALLDVGRCPLPTSLPGP